MAYKDDPLVKTFVKEIPTQSFADYLLEVYDYIEETYGCSFSQFLSQITYPEYLEASFWDNKREDKEDIKLTVDDAFYEVTVNKRRKTLLGDGNTSVYRDTHEVI